MEKLLKIDEVTFKNELYPRTGVTYITVGNYTEKMRVGEKFPPIVVGKIGKELILVDGYHRLLATKRLEQEYIKAVVKSYDSMKDIFKDAIELNSRHGIQFTASDNVKMLATLEDMEFTPFEIAGILKATPERVERYKSRIIRKRNGDRVFLKAPIARLLETGHITEQEALNVDQSQLKVQNIRDLMVQIIAVLQGHVYPWGDEDMRALAGEVYQLLGRSVNINDVS